MNSRQVPSNSTELIPKPSFVLRVLLAAWILYWPCMVVTCACAPWQVRVQIVLVSAFVICILGVIVEFQDPRFVTSYFYGKEIFAQIENSSVLKRILGDALDSAFGAREPWRERFRGANMHMTILTFASGIYLVSVPFAQLGWTGATLLIACAFVSGFCLWSTD